MGVSQSTAILIMFILCGIGLVGMALRAGLEWVQKRFNLIDKDEE